MVWKISERKTGYFVFRVLFFHSSIVVLYYNISIYLFTFNADKSTIKTERHQLPISRQKLSTWFVCLFVCLLFRASTSTHYNNDYIAIITEWKSFLLKKCLSVCIMPACTRIDDLKKKSHSKKRSSLQTNFLPCS